MYLLCSECLKNIKDFHLTVPCSHSTDKLTHSVFREVPLISANSASTLFLLELMIFEQSLVLLVSIFIR